MIVTIREPSAATLAKSISINARGGMVNPEFALSKTYPTVGYLTRPLNLTITVMHLVVLAINLDIFGMSMEGS